MCISADASKNMYIVGLISAFLLVNFGLKSLRKENLYLTIVFLYIILMQVIDYLVWIDLDCKRGTNRLAGILGSFLNYSQPLIILLVGYLVITKKINKNIKKLNIIYVILLAIFLIRFYMKGDFCTKIDRATGNLRWSWTKEPLIKVMMVAYIIVLFANLLTFTENNYMVTAIGLIIFYLLLVLLKVKNYNSIGNMWCFITPTIVLLYLFVQRAFPKFSINKIDKKYLRNITSM